MDVKQYVQRNPLFDVYVGVDFGDTESRSATVAFQYNHELGRYEQIPMGSLFDARLRGFSGSFVLGGIKHPVLSRKKGRINDR